jgi:transposase
MVAIPALEEEDAKRPHRERVQLVGKRTGLVNRIKAICVRHGIRGFKPNLRSAPDRVTALRTPEGGPLPPNTLAEMLRELQHLRFIKEQIKQIEKTRLEQLERTSPEARNATRDLSRIRGLGIETADMLASEVFPREYRDQRAIARSRRHEKGLAKAGNARVRRGMIQLAWRFLTHQKDSGLAQWFEARVAAGMKRKTAIVAMARKLLIALWRFVTLGEVPDGVILAA